MTRRSILVMNIDIHVVNILVGTLLTMYGALILLSDKFFNAMKRHLWVGEEQDKRNWSPKGIENFNKYGKGLGAFLAGIILLIFSLVYYVSH